MTLDKRVESLLEELGLKKYQLAERMGVAPQRIKEMLQGEPRKSTIEKLAKALGVEPGELLDSQEAPAGYVKMSIVCKIAAGKPIEAVCNCDHGHRDVPARKAKNAALIKVYGDSMSPYFLDGDVVLVKLNPSPDIGKIVVARKNPGGELTIKRLKQSGKVLFLWPENPAYDPIVLGPREEWQIIGYADEIIERKVK